MDSYARNLRHEQFALIVSDLGKECILAMLPDREKMTLEAWIDTRSSQEQKPFRFVSSDMWASYHQAARKKLHHAKVVMTVSISRSWSSMAPSPPFSTEILRL